MISFYTNDLITNTDGTITIQSNLPVFAGKSHLKAVLISPTCFRSKEINF